MLKIRELVTGYGKKQVLFGLSMEISKGEIVALIGPNGAGKSTVLKTACGLIPAWSGEILFNDVKINGFTPGQNAARGMTFAPQGSRVFTELSVIENLKIGGFQIPRSALSKRIENVFQMFPLLKERKRLDAGKLSNGEQQMLALARALVPSPKLLMLDEPSLGLSPSIVGLIFRKVAEINTKQGVSILIVEQKVREVLDISHRVYSIKLGKVAFSGNSEELKEDKDRLKLLFL